MKRKRLLQVLIMGLFYLIFVILSLTVLTDLIMQGALALGLSKKGTENLGMIVIAILALVYTSEGFYHALSKTIERQLKKAKGWWAAGLKAQQILLNFLMALPLRTILFLVYLLFIILEQLELIDKAKDYVTIAVFVVGVDRVGKTIPGEKEKFQTYWGNFRRLLGLEAKDEQK
ncbi:hypothetical protein [Streptococcus macacae]|uniref:Uncharacterized protein n=1 Tax=Streptococcus macacae NCTC 11558 TaxID=764298 RepID=G5JUQ3_9STRE|nr:hypothetical protein [Streptococcus macacae]EHJ52710.1 hypothetical protein STRMA_1043 [Streptococcus macacae NCTC 11558]SUN78867.1 membrane protein [Streptococcus macacae NCTC 11558]